MSWAIRKLGDICTVKRGTTITQKQAIEGDVPVVAGGLNPTYYHNAANRFGKTITISASGANAGFVNFWSQPIFASDCSTVEVDDSVLDILYIYFFLLSKQEFIYKKLRSGAAQPHVYGKDIAGLDIAVPPLPIQQKIVAKLDAIFAEIDRATMATEANAKNAENYFSMFLDQMISTFDNKDIKKIEDVCDLYQGLAINKKTSHLLVEKSNLPLLRIKDLKSGTEEQFVSESGFPKNSLVSEDEIIYTRTGSLGLVFMGRRGVLHNNSFKVKPRKDVDNIFLFWWLQSSKFKSKIMDLALKAAQPDISHKIFKEQEITIPTMEDQKIFAIKAKEAKSISIALHNIYENKIKQLADLKQAILQQAFNGELVKD